MIRCFRQKKVAVVCINFYGSIFEGNAKKSLENLIDGARSSETTSFSINIVFLVVFCQILSHVRHVISFSVGNKHNRVLDSIFEFGIFPEHFHLISGRNKIAVETCISHYIPDTKKQSKRGVYAGNPAPKTVKMAGKSMIMVIFELHAELSA